MFFIIYFRTKYLIKHLLTWMYFGLRWVVVDGGGYILAVGAWRWEIYFGWWWVVVDGGEYIMAGGGCWWVVVDGDGWWHSLV